MAIPVISDLLERLFGAPEDPHSRDDVKRRLKIVLAHDRLALDPQTLEMMRQEIIAVVSRYVEVDFDALEFSLATDQRVTALTANLPIRRIRPLARGADQPIAPDAEAEKIELASQAEIQAMNEAAVEPSSQSAVDDNISDDTAPVNEQPSEADESNPSTPESPEADITTDDADLSEPDKTDSSNLDMLETSTKNGTRTSTSLTPPSEITETKAKAEEAGS